MSEVWERKITCATANAFGGIEIPLVFVMPSTVEINKLVNSIRSVSS